MADETHRRRRRQRVWHGTDDDLIALITAAHDAVHSEANEDEPPTLAVQFDYAGREVNSSSLAEVRETLPKQDFKALDGIYVEISGGSDVGLELSLRPDGVAFTVRGTSQVFVNGVTSAMEAAIRRGQPKLHWIRALGWVLSGLSLPFVLAALVVQQASDYGSFAYETTTERLMAAGILCLPAGIVVMVLTSALMPQLEIVTDPQRARLRRAWSAGKWILLVVLGAVIDRLVTDVL